MKTKLPPISYLVTAKYSKNSAGLKSLFHKVYSCADFHKARNKAFEFYSATIEILMDNKEISFDLNDAKIDFSKKPFHLIIEHCNNLEVNYKFPTDFKKGIQVFIRLNEDVDLKNRSFKKDELLLIESFNFLTPKEINEISQNQQTELEIYKHFNQKKNKTFRQLIFSDDGYFKEHFSLFTHHRFNGSRSHKIFQEQIEKQIEKSSTEQYLGLLKSENRLRIEFCKPENFDFLAETVCAFLNGNEVCYISIELPNTKYHFGNNKNMQQISMDFLQKKFVFNGHQIRFYTFSKNGKDYAFYRIDGENCKEKVGFPVDDEETRFEEYERTRFGNVLIFD